MLKDKEIADLRNGEWEILCPEMTLKMNGKRKHSGSGLIRQTEQKNFEFIIFDGKTFGGIERNLRHLFIDQYKNIKAGQIIPSSEKYTLFTSQGWGAKNLYHINHNYTQNGTIITGYTNELFEIINHADSINLFKRERIKRGKLNNRKYTSWFSKPGVHFIIFDKLNYPANTPTIIDKHLKDEESYPGFNLNALKFRSANYDIRIVSTDNGVEYSAISIKKRKSHKDNIENRSLEALEYILGRPIKWNIKRIFSSNEERIHIRVVNPHINYNSYAKPPLVCQSPTWIYFSALFMKYLEYIIRDKRKGTHHIADRISEINHTCLFSLDVAILTLATEIEGLVKEYYKRKYEPDINFIKDVEKINKLIMTNKQTLSISEKSYSKVVSSLGYLKSEVPTRKLFELLIDNGSIDKRDVDAWNHVRHKRAHGNRLDINQEQIDISNKCFVLLQQLIFSIIGYKGHFTDYGEWGFPMKPYIKNLYSYIIKHDDGAAPNPFWDYCTLSCCKPAIRRTAQVGDWIVGLSPVSEGNKIVCVMQVTQKMTFADYFKDPKFKDKKPDMTSTELVKKRGDNIYEPLSKNRYRQLPSVHSNGKRVNRANKKRDLSGKYVLISSKYWYFGTNAIELPSEYKPLIVGRGHKRKFSQGLIKKFIYFIESQKMKGLIGYPKIWSDEPLTCKSDSKC